MKRAAPAVLAALFLSCVTAIAALERRPAGMSNSNWTRFGYDAARQNSGPYVTGITAANVQSLEHQQVQLDGTVDSSPVYARKVGIGGSRHDVFVVQTTYGKVAAVDADTGAVLWEFTPSGFSSVAGTHQITTSSPALGPERQYVYSASPDGRIHKLIVATGEEVTTGSWPVTATLDPEHEKLGTSLNLVGDLLIATTGGYPGDIPPYQGHVVVIDRDTGRTVNIWNALCSGQRELIVPSSCRVSGAAIWARAGAVVQPGTRRLIVATGNGPFDGHTRWSTSVIVLSADAGRVLRYWTPRNHQYLASQDLDLGSTAPALLAANLVVQGGKDGKLRLLDLRRMHAPPKGNAKAPLGGELQTVPTPGGAMLFSAPAVWHNKGQSWLFVADNVGTSAFVLEHGRLKLRWTRSAAGTSPVIAGDLLYVYDWDAGRLNVYIPTSGRRVAGLPAGRGHWNSPIVSDGRIALGQEDANAHVTFGVLNIYRLP